MQPLDGNVLAGPLFDYFGTDMTSVRGSCGHCGASVRIAELRAYVNAPGKIARCARCREVVFVLVEARGELRGDFSHLRLPRA